MDVLSPEFTTGLLRVILRDHAFLRKARNLLSIDLWKDANDRRLVRSVLTYYDRYGSTPSKESFLHYLESAGFDDGTVEDVKSRFYEPEIKDISYTFDILRSFVKKSRYRDALLKGMDRLQKGDFESIYRDFQSLAYSFSSGDDAGDFFFDMAKPVLASLGKQEAIIPSGFSGLDDVLFGGPIRGTQNVILTPPNCGKTTTLVNVGKYAMLEGYKVAHLTTELSSVITARRYLMSLTRMSKQELKSKKRTAYDKILDLAEKVAKENLIIKRFPPNSCTVKNVIEWLESIRNSHGFIPDVLIIDMAQYLRSPKQYDEKRFELSDIYLDLRDVAVNYNLVQWTAHQTNRGGGQDRVITTRDLAEDFGIAGITDVIVSINQDLEERRNNEARLFTAKSRDDSSFQTITIETDWSRCWLGDME